MSATAHALPRQLQSNFQVGTTEVHDLDNGRELWMISATSQDGQRRTSKSDDDHQAVLRPAGLMGFEVEDG